MKSDMLQNAIGEIKDEYIFEAMDDVKPVAEPKKAKSKKVWRVLTPILSACCCVAICVAVLPTMLHAKASDAEMSYNIAEQAGERDVVYDDQYRDNMNELKVYNGEQSQGNEVNSAKNTSPRATSNANNAISETKDFYNGVFLPYDTSVDKSGSGMPNSALDMPFDTDSMKVKLISGSDGAFTIDDIAVNNGKVEFSGTLKKWVDLWPTSDVANPDDLFQVGVVLFKDGKQLACGSEEELKECDRLFLEGDYQPTRVTFSEPDGKIGHEFYIICTMDQLLNFPASESLGYQLMLYDEYAYHFYGRSTDYDGSVPVTYNPVIIPEDIK